METIESVPVMPVKKEEKKIRVIALCDSPTSATGFAQVSKNILNGLYKTGKYHIDVIGINFYGDAYDRKEYPYNIFPAMPQGYRDMYGRGRLTGALSGQQATYGLVPPYDIVFTIQDPFVIEGMGMDYPFGEQLRVSMEMWKRALKPEMWHTWIGYWPVDSDLKENWVTRSIALPDYPVAYCNWGKIKMLAWDKDHFDLRFNLKPNTQSNAQPAVMKVPSLSSRVRVIHHGVNTNVFKPLSLEEKQKFRKEFFSGEVKPDDFLVVNVSRNQPRKDLARTLKAFSLFKKRVPKAHLYLHCKAHDAGGSIEESARNFDLVMGRDYSFPTGFDAGIGYPPEKVNQIYNAADLCLTTTLGEGWGFITTEAMATKTPIIAPNITSILDIFDSYNYKGTLEELETRKELRGIPVKAGSTNSEWVSLGAEDNERIRPLTNVDDLVEKMVWVKEHPEATQVIVERAYEWVKTLNWDNIVKEWDSLFVEAYEKLQKARELGENIDKAGRNDPCPCGSGQKFKHCHGTVDKLNLYKDWLEGGEKINGK